MKGFVMRFSIGFLSALAVVSALPSIVSAQGTEKGTKPEPSAQEPEPSSGPAREEGGLSPRLRKRTQRNWDPDTYELRLDSSSRSVSPPPAPRHETDSRVLRYRQGVIVSSLFIGIGGALIGGGVVVLRNWQQEESRDPSWDLFPPGGTYVLFTLGTLGALGGLIGAAISGSKLGARKRKLREHQEARYERRRRAQWDFARSRLVF